MPADGQDVKFNYYTRTKFNALSSKDNNTIYYVGETDGEIKQYLGSKLVSRGGAEVNVQSNWTQTNTTADDYIKNKPTTFPPIAHNHPISQVTGLQGALDGKANLTGAKFTGNINTTSITNTHYAQNVLRFSTTSTPVQTVIYTKIKYQSGAHMPVLRIYGYAYGLNSPIELKIGFYIYGGNLGWSGAVSMGSWRPEIFLFKYNEGGVDYVGVGLKGSVYYLAFQVDVQTVNMGSIGNSILINGWSSASRTQAEVDASNTIIPSLGVNNCVKVPYKSTLSSLKLQFNGVAQEEYDGANPKTLNITPAAIGARPAGNVPWGEVSGKPSFAPSNAQKNSDITKAEIEAKLKGVITSHTHNIAQVTNLQTELDGKASTSYVNGKIFLKSDTDNRSVKTIPNDYNSKFEIKGLKSNSAIGISGGGHYSALLGIRGWTDSSGGDAHELAFDSSGRIGHRYGSTTTWNTWKFLIESDDPRLTNARPASDVHSWAKAENPPKYTAAEVGARPGTWTPTAAQVGAVPISRTVNGKALSSNISLSAGDVGAYTKTEVDNKIAAIPTPDLTPYAKLAGAEFTGDITTPKINTNHLVGSASVSIRGVGLSLGVVGTGVRMTLAGTGITFRDTDIIQGVPNITAESHSTSAANKKYVDDKVAAIPAPNLTPYAKLTGAEFTGDVNMFGYDNYIQYATIGAIAVEDGLSMGYNKIQLLAEPTVNTDAATKKYVDDKLLTQFNEIFDIADTEYAFSNEVVKLSGNQTNITGTKTFTGTVNVPAPTANTNAATKKYVDDKVAAGGGSSTKFSKEFWIEAADDTTDLYPYLEANKQYRYTVGVYGDNMGANVVFNNLTSKSFVLMTKAATNTSTVKVPSSYGEGTITLGGNKYTVSVTNVMGRVHVENAVTSLYLRANSYSSASDAFILNIWEV